MGYRIYVKNNNTYTEIETLPQQSSTTEGKYLKSSNSVASWEEVIALPTQTGNSGKILTTDGTDASWVPIENVYIKKGKKYLYAVEEDYASGLTITLPSTPTDYGYTVGNDEFDIYMGGAKLTSEQFTEVGTTGTTSHSVTIPGYVPSGHDIEICFVPSLVIGS